MSERRFGNVAGSEYTMPEHRIVTQALEAGICSGCIVKLLRADGYRRTSASVRSYIMKLRKAA